MYCKKMLLLLFSIISLSVVQSASQDKIIFPPNDDIQKNCTFPSGQTGTCINIRDCATAMADRESTLQTCRFEGKEHIVCCREQRIAERACAAYYFPVSGIIMGIPTKPKEFPYMVALGWHTLDAGKYEYKCGGTLIDWDMVLTAAHCTHVGGAEPTVVLAGGVDLTDNITQPVEVAKIFVHPEYDRKKAYHDIALIKLKTAPRIDFNPACISEDFSLKAINATAIGYGHTIFGGKPSNQLLKAYFTLVHNELCKYFYTDLDALPKGLQEQQLCAKDIQFNRDTCQGDSGSPLLVIRPGSWRPIPYIVGITSFGLGCATPAPGVYVRVSKYLDWIEPIVWPNKKIMGYYAGGVVNNQEAK